MSTTTAGLPKVAAALLPVPLPVPFDPAAHEGTLWLRGERPVDAVGPAELGGAADDADAVPAAAQRPIGPLPETPH